MEDSAIKIEKENVEMTQSSITGSRRAAPKRAVALMQSSGKGHLGSELTLTFHTFEMIRLSALLSILSVHRQSSTTLLSRASQPNFP